MMKLYTFFQSGSAYRARIALAYKAIDYEPVHVAGGRGSQDLQKPDYLRKNPSGVVPTLVDDDVVVTQSLAILEYLEERYPQPPLLPPDAAGRARVRAMAQIMISDTHPLSTARVIAYLDEALHLDEAAQQAWLRHWNERGFAVIETMLKEESRCGPYCHGAQPSFADIALVSQIFVARKFGCRFESTPTVAGIYEQCMRHPAFAQSAPEMQGDAPSAS